MARPEPIILKQLEKELGRPRLWPSEPYITAAFFNESYGITL
jgi:hypothetical protein